MDILNNKYFKSVILLIIVLYSSLLKPKLPKIIKNLFKNSIFRILILSYVVYIGNNDIKISLAVTVAFIVTMNYLREAEVDLKYNKDIRKQINNLKKIRNKSFNT